MTGFFGPGTALVSSGFFGGATGGGGGWTARTIGTAASGFNTNVAAANGVALLVDSNGEVWRSVDGGHSWSDTGENLPTVTQVVGSGSTLLLFANNQSWRTVDGLSFSGPHALNFTGLNGFATAAGNGSGTWVAGSTGSRNTSISTDDGLTWTQHTIVTGSGNWVVSYIFDGTEWVGLTSGNQIATSPNGTAWTFTNLTPGGEFFNNTLGFQSGTPNNYLCTIFNGINQPVRRATTPAGLASAADIATGIPGSSGLQNVLVGNGKAWVFDNTGLTAGSADGGATWSQVPLNFQVGDFPGTVFQAYDAVNHSFIAIGAIGTSIATHNDSDIL